MTQLMMIFSSILHVDLNLITNTLKNWKINTIGRMDSIYKPLKNQVNSRMKERSFRREGLSNGQWRILIK